MNGKLMKSTFQLVFSNRIEPTGVQIKGATEIWDSTQPNYCHLVYTEWETPNALKTAFLGKRVIS